MIAVLGGVYFISDFLNRDLRNLMLIAKSRVKNKLLKRECICFFDEFNLSKNKKNSILNILEKLSVFLELNGEICYFRPNDKLSYYFRINNDEFKELIDIKKSKKYMQDNYIDLNYDLFYDYCIDEIEKKGAVDKLKIKVYGESEDEMMERFIQLELIDLLELVINEELSQK